MNPTDAAQVREAGADEVISGGTDDLGAALRRLKVSRSARAFRSRAAALATGPEVSAIQATFDGTPGEGSIAAIHVDDMDDLEVDLGIEAANTVRRRVLLALEEVASTYPDAAVITAGSREIILVAPVTGADEIIPALEAAITRLRARPVSVGPNLELGATFSAACGSRGEDGDTYEALLAACRRTLRSLERSGEGLARAVRVGWIPGGEAQRADVLIIDDDEASATVVRHTLQQAGLTVDHCRSAEEATATYIENGQMPARVLLTEISLPGIDGFEFLRTMGRRGTLGNSSVIVLTRRASEQEVVEAFRLGAFDHVAKPFSPSVLVQRVRRAHRQVAS